MGLPPARPTGQISGSSSKRACLAHLPLRNPKMIRRAPYNGEEPEVGTKNSLVQISLQPHTAPF